MTDARALLFLEPRKVEVRSLRVPDEPPAGGAILKVLASIEFNPLSVITTMIASDTSTPA